jgi:tellurite resistance protein
MDVLKRSLGANLNKYSGNKDFLEAVCAAGAIVAAADGTVEDSEIVACVEMAANNEKLRAAYSQGEIEECMDRMLKRAKTVSGRAGLNRELDDCAKSELTMREDIVLAALDVAMADGSIGPAEKSAIDKIASRLGVNPDKFA